MFISKLVALRTLRTLDPCDAGSNPLAELLFTLGAIIEGCAVPPLWKKVGTVETPAFITNTVELVTAVTFAPQ